MNLYNKKILITGASSGLGLEIASQMVKLGAMVWGTCYKKPIERLSLENNPNFELVECDVSDYIKTAELLQKITKSYGSIDILINNAGLYIEGELVDNDISQILAVINTNLVGTILTTKAVLPYMLEQNTGLIFSVSSNCGIYNKKQRSVYGATKWGIRGFVDNLKLDLQGSNIKAFGFYPAGIQTELFANAGLCTDTTNMMTPQNVANLIIDILCKSDQYVLDHIVIDKPNITKSPVSQNLNQLTLLQKNTKRTNTLIPKLISNWFGKIKKPRSIK
jgi:NADP-dependent 3-hydroxy acid dehydrogenase YdfG